MDEDLFTSNQLDNMKSPTYAPPRQSEDNENDEQSSPVPPTNQNNEASGLDFGSYPSNNQGSANYIPQGGDNEFNDFEEDQMTKRIREEEERIQTQLRQKSQKEYEQKNARREEGRRQLEQFQDRKDKEKRERAEENTQKEERLREEYKKINEEAGWRKVVSNVNLKQGEYKGKKDINRMREAILHKRQDDARS